MSNLLVPRAEELLAVRPGFSAPELKELAHEMYTEGTLDHVPTQWISAGIVEKWSPDQMERLTQEHGNKRLEREDLYRLIGAPEEITDDLPSNILTNGAGSGGINRLLNLLIGTGSIAAYTNSISRTGVGTSTTAESASQTDLQAAAGSTNRFFQAAAASYPQVSGSTFTMQSTFGTADGNFAWQEWGIDGGGSSGTTVGTFSSSNAGLLNRKVASLGTKASGSTWTITTTIVIS